MTLRDLLSPGLTKGHEVSSNLIKIIFCEQFYSIKDVPRRGYSTKYIGEDLIVYIIEFVFPIH